MNNTAFQARSRALTLTALALASALVVSACNKGSVDANAETTPSVVMIGGENIAIVQQRSLESGPSISGSLAAEREATIRAEIGGAVLQTYAEQGQRVAAGTLLARIDDAGVRDSWLSARSGVTSAQSSADLASRELARAKTLVAAGAIADRDLEQSQRGNVAAQAGLADARARLALAEKNLEHTQIKAPFPGIISEKQVSAGDIVSPGGALYTVIDPSTMRLEASVPAERLSGVRVGMPVAFEVNGYPGRAFTGRIVRVSPTADPVTRQVRIIASIPNAGSTLVGGLFAEGRVASESHNGLVVPLTAVDERGLQPSVVKVTGGTVHRTVVELGLRDALTESVEVRKGIAAGDTVLIGAAQGISDGTRVRVGNVTDASKRGA